MTAITILFLRNKAVFSAALLNIQHNRELKIFFETPFKVYSSEVLNASQYLYLYSSVTPLDFEIRTKEPELPSLSLKQASSSKAVL